MSGGEVMAEFWKALGMVLYFVVTMPLFALGLVAGFLWVSLACGWFWGVRGAEEIIE